MFASRRAFSVSTRQFPCRAIRAIPHPARLYSTEAAAPASTSATEEAPSTPATPATKPASTTTAAPNSYKPASYAAAKAVKAVKPAKSTAPTLSYSDIVYNAKTVAHEDQPAGGEVAEIPLIDWASSFHGISSRPVTERQFKSLMEPVSEKDIEVKPDGVIYLPEIKYRRRLNEAFGPMGWGIIPKGEAVVGDNIVTREYALIVDGRFVSQAQGENSYFSPEQLPSAVEGCKSNALMRCCKDLGIASELWDPHFVRWFKKNHMEEVWVEHQTTKKKRPQWYRKGDVDVAYPYKLSGSK